MRHANPIDTCARWAVASIALSAGAAWGAEPAADVEALRARLAEQIRQLEQLKQDLQRQEQELVRLRQQLDGASGAATPATAGAPTPAPARAAAGRGHFMRGARGAGGGLREAQPERGVMAGCGGKRTGTAVAINDDALLGSRRGLC
ncbi:MAG: hypothetical protein QM639_16180, partial [Rhodocyclaceae bacterium]